MSSNHSSSHGDQGDNNGEENDNPFTKFIEQPDPPTTTGTLSTDNGDDDTDDTDFEANEAEAVDDEEDLAAEEEAHGVGEAHEIEDLEEEANMSLDDLIAKYYGNGIPSSSSSENDDDEDNMDEEDDNSMEAEEDTKDNDIGISSDSRLHHPSTTTTSIPEKTTADSSSSSSSTATKATSTVDPSAASSTTTSRSNRRSTGVAASTTIPTNPSTIPQQQPQSSFSSLTTTSSTTGNRRRPSNRSSTTLTSSTATTIANDNIPTETTQQSSLSTDHPASTTTIPSEDDNIEQTVSIVPSTTTTTTTSIRGGKAIRGRGKGRSTHETTNTVDLSIPPPPPVADTSLPSSSLPETKGAEMIMDEDNYGYDEEYDTFQTEGGAGGTGTSIINMRAPRGRGGRGSGRGRGRGRGGFTMMTLGQLLQRRVEILTDLRNRELEIQDRNQPDFGRSIYDTDLAMASVIMEQGESAPHLSLQRSAALAQADAQESSVTNIEESTTSGFALASATGPSKQNKEPQRNKVHWDWVLQEMEWLAGAFTMERQDKLKVLNKLSGPIRRHRERKDKQLLEAAVADELRRRRRAAKIAAHVGKFWARVDKLVIYKHRSRLDAMRRMAQDKHLNFLVGQTEKYTSLLAQNVTNTTQYAAAEISNVGSSSSSASSVVSGTGSRKRDRQGNDKGPTAADTSSVISSNTVPSQTSSVRTKSVVRPEEPIPFASATKRVRKTETVNEPTTETTTKDENTDDDTRPAGVPYTTLPSSSSASATGIASNTEDISIHEDAPVGEGGDGVDDSSEDFEAESEEDDEETIEAEEREMARRRARQRRQQAGIMEDDEEGNDIPIDDDNDDGAENNEDEDNELDLLNREAEMSIDELRRLYGADSMSTMDNDDIDNGTENKEGMGMDNAEDDDDDDDDNDESASTSNLALLLEEPVVTSGRPRRSAAKKALEHIHQETKAVTMVDHEMNGTVQTKAPISSAPVSAPSPTYVIPVPFLMRNGHLLRPYQREGLDWLVSMHDRRLNGILADEMGLGKTIQTISLLAHLAAARGVWGPHLIVVPTSTMLNWDMEFKRWAPAFKVVTYYGGVKERKLKRLGWTKPNAFHVCVTSYQMVLTDSSIFKRQRWDYLILDEAHYIKNYQSARWQTLLSFQSRRRLLLTGTPLQNSLMELWSLMHFLMPHLFRSQDEFKKWFSTPLTAHVEGVATVDPVLVGRLHNLLRPFILRRLKSTVATQMPKKYEHVLTCRLSNRQRYLYEDFLSRSSTRASLTGGNFMSMMNVLMQLRKVCNHPDLFEERPILSAFQLPQIQYNAPSMVIDPRVFNFSGNMAGSLGHVLHGIPQFGSALAKIDKLNVTAIVSTVLQAGGNEQTVFDLLDSFSLGSNASGTLNFSLTRALPLYRVTYPWQTMSILSPRLIIEDLGDAKHDRYTDNTHWKPRTNFSSRTITLRRSVATFTVNGHELPLPGTMSTVMYDASEGMNDDEDDTNSDASPLQTLQRYAKAQEQFSLAFASGVTTLPILGPGLGLADLEMFNPYEKWQYNEMDALQTPQRLLCGPEAESRTFSLRESQQGLSSEIEKAVDYVIMQASIREQSRRNTGKGGIPTNSLDTQEVTTTDLLTGPTSRFAYSVILLHAAVRVRERMELRQRINRIAEGNKKRCSTMYGPLYGADLRRMVSLRYVAGWLGHRLGWIEMEEDADALFGEGPMAVPFEENNLFDDIVGTDIVFIDTHEGSSNVSMFPKTKKSADEIFVLPSGPIGRPQGAIRGGMVTPAALAKPSDIVELSRLTAAPGTLSSSKAWSQQFIFDANKAHSKEMKRNEWIQSRYGTSVAATASLGSKRRRGGAPLSPTYGYSSPTSQSITELITPGAWATYSSTLREMVRTPQERYQEMLPLIERYVFLIPKTSVHNPRISALPLVPLRTQRAVHAITKLGQKVQTEIHDVVIRTQLSFPDRRLVEFDCGKLQMLFQLLKERKAGGHRCLIFTQMTRMLDILETFLNLHDHTYLRLDGSTKVEERQSLMDRFNRDPRLFVFILSTRSGGLGINLVGADTVIFYDSDWNPAMDAQAQDRAHRIGQTRDVHIYRLITESTVEENILVKARQKRDLQNLSLEEGQFTMATLQNLSVRDILGDDASKRLTTGTGSNGGDNGTATVNIDATLLDAPLASASTIGAKKSGTITGADIENALAAAEDEADVEASKAAWAEAKQELSEFDEKAPLIADEGNATGTGAKDKSTVAETDNEDDEEGTVPKLIKEGKIGKGKIPPKKGGKAKGKGGKGKSVTVSEDEEDDDEEKTDQEMNLDSSLSNDEGNETSGSGSESEGDGSDQDNDDDDMETDDQNENADTQESGKEDDDNDETETDQPDDDEDDDEEEDEEGTGTKNRSNKKGPSKKVRFANGNGKKEKSKIPITDLTSESETDGPDAEGSTTKKTKKGTKTSKKGVTTGKRSKGATKKEEETGVRRSARRAALVQKSNLDIDLDALEKSALAEEELGSAPTPVNDGTSTTPGGPPKTNAMALFNAAFSGTSAATERPQLDRVAIAVAKFAEIEGRLRPAEQYALRYRELRDPHPWVEPNTLRYVESQCVIEEKEWELDQLRAIKEKEEAEAEADALALNTLDIKNAETMQAASGTLEFIESGSGIYQETLRVLRHGIRMRALTGTAWELRTDDESKELFYYNIDTKEAVWEKPLILRQRDARQRVRQEGYGSLLHLPSVALNIMRMLNPSERIHTVSQVSKSWKTMVNHPLLFKFVRQPVHNPVPTITVGNGAAFKEDTAAKQVKNTPNVTKLRTEYEKRTFDSLSDAIGTCVAGDTIVVAFGSHYVPHSLYIDQPIRIVSQGVYGCFFAGYDSNDEEWIVSPNGDWYPHIKELPPTVARLLGLHTSYVSDIGFASLGVGLNYDTAVADSAVVRMDGPLVWRVTRPAYRPSVPSVSVNQDSDTNTVPTEPKEPTVGTKGSSTDSTILNELLEAHPKLHTYEAAYRQEHELPAVSSVQIHNARSGGGQLRGVTLRNVRATIPFCLVVQGPGSMVALVPDRETITNIVTGHTPLPTVLPSPTVSSIAMEDTSSVTVGTVNASMDVSATALTVPSGSTVTTNPRKLPKRVPTHVSLPLPLEIVQCDLGNRSGAGACVAIVQGGNLAMMGCRIAAGTGSGVLVDEGSTASLIHVTIQDCGSAGINIRSGVVVADRVRISSCGGPAIRIFPIPVLLPDQYPVPSSATKNETMDDANDESTELFTNDTKEIEAYVTKSMLQSLQPVTNDAKALHAHRIWTSLPHRIRQLPGSIYITNSELQGNWGGSWDIPLHYWSLGYVFTANNEMDPGIIPAVPPGRSSQNNSSRPGRGFSVHPTNDEESITVADTDEHPPVSTHLTNDGDNEETNSNSVEGSTSRTVRRRIHSQGETNPDGDASTTMESPTSVATSSRTSTAPVTSTRKKGLDKYGVTVPSVPSLSHVVYVLVEADNRLEEHYGISSSNSSTTVTVPNESTVDHANAAMEAARRDFAMENGVQYESNGTALSQYSRNVELYPSRLRSSGGNQAHRDTGQVKRRVYVHVAADGSQIYIVTVSKKRPVIYHPKDSANSTEITFMETSELPPGVLVPMMPSSSASVSVSNVSDSSSFLHPSGTTSLAADLLPAVETYLSGLSPATIRPHCSVFMVLHTYELGGLATITARRDPTAYKQAMDYQDRVTKIVRAGKTGGDKAMVKVVEKVRAQQSNDPNPYAKHYIGVHKPGGFASAVKKTNSNTNTGSDTVDTVSAEDKAMVDLILSSAWVGIDEEPEEKMDESGSGSNSITVTDTNNNEGITVSNSTNETGATVTGTKNNSKNSRKATTKVIHPPPSVVTTTESLSRSSVPPPPPTDDSSTLVTTNSHTMDTIEIKQETPSSTVPETSTEIVKPAVTTTISSTVPDVTIASSVPTILPLSIVGGVTTTTTSSATVSHPLKPLPPSIIPFTSSLLSPNRTGSNTVGSTLPLFPSSPSSTLPPFLFASPPSILPPGINPLFLNSGGNNNGTIGLPLTPSSRLLPGSTTTNSIGSSSNGLQPILPLLPNTFMNNNSPNLPNPALFSIAPLPRPIGGLPSLPSIHGGSSLIPGNSMSLPVNNNYSNNNGNNGGVVGSSNLLSPLQRFVGGFNPCPLPLPPMSTTTTTLPIGTTIVFPPTTINNNNSSSSSSSSEGEKK